MTQGTSDIFDPDSLERIRQEKIKRLRVLEAQSARLGYDTPADIQMEIGEIRATLGFVDSIVQSSISADVVQAVGPTGQILALSYELKMMRQHLDGALRNTEDQLRDWKDKDATWKEEDAEARKIGQRNRLIVDVVFSVLILILLIIVAGIAFNAYVQTYYIPK